MQRLKRISLALALAGLLAVGLGCHGHHRGHYHGWYHGGHHVWHYGEHGHHGGGHHGGGHHHR